MNKQQGPGRIEWTDYTWNPIAGCHHGCEWNMPDGVNAICYAKELVDTMPQMKQHYPRGFAHHYFHPNRLREPLLQKTPAKIFADSMSDFCGGWVPMEDSLKVLDVVKQAHWHTFQFLTKAPHRVHLYPWPGNAWVGVSSPPDIWGGKKTASPRIRRNYIENTAENLKAVRARGNTVWMSVEPLNFDIAGMLLELGLFETLDWIVVGAASHGRIKVQPRPQWVENLVVIADVCGIPVFFKGNLRNSKAIPKTGWREEFPKARTVRPAPAAMQQAQLYSLDQG